jgi:hypothetical protein
MEFDVSVAFGEQRTPLNLHKVKELLIQRIKLALVERFVAPNRRYFRIPTVTKKDPNSDIIPTVEVKANLKNREQSTTLQRELEFREFKNYRTVQFDTQPNSVNFIISLLFLLWVLQSLGLNNNNNNNFNHNNNNNNNNLSATEKTIQGLNTSALMKQFTDQNGKENVSKECEAPTFVPTSQKTSPSPSQPSPLTKPQETTHDEVIINNKRVSFKIPSPNPVVVEHMSSSQLSTISNQQQTNELNAFNSLLVSDDTELSHSEVEKDEDETGSLLVNPTYSVNSSSEGLKSNTFKESTKDRLKQSLKRGKEKIRKLFHRPSLEEKNEKEQQ